jgi:hypothetical protein
MLVTINTPKVQAPFGVSLFHPLLIIHGHNQNYMKDIQTKYYILYLLFGNMFFCCFFWHFVYIFLTFIKDAHFWSVLFYIILLIYSLTNIL